MTNIKFQPGQRVRVTATVEELRYVYISKPLSSRLIGVVVTVIKELPKEHWNPEPRVRIDFNGITLWVFKSYLKPLQQQLLLFPELED